MLNGMTGWGVFATKRAMKALGAIAAAAMLVATMPSPAEAGKKGRVAAAVAGGIIAGAVIGSAIAHDRHYGGHHYVHHRKRYYYGGHYYHRRHYHRRHYYRHYRPYRYYYRPRVVHRHYYYRHYRPRYHHYSGRPAPWTPAWYSYCARKYRSFDPGSGTFQPYHGPRKLCR